MTVNILKIAWILLITLVLGVLESNGQAINPMMYGMGQYMNPYYTGFYGGFGNMGNLNPLGYQLSSGMAIPGGGGGGGYGGGGGQYFGGATAGSTPNVFTITTAAATIFAALRFLH